MDDSTRCDSTVDAGKHPPTGCTRVYRMPLNQAIFRRHSALVGRGDHAEAVSLLAPYARAPYISGLIGQSLLALPDQRHRALRWLLRAAQLGSHSEVMALQIGQCYAQGIGTAVNPLRAYAWLHSAARQGSPEATLALGELELAGLSRPIDKVRALMWFMLTAASTYEFDLNQEATRQQELLINELTSSETIRACDLGMLWLAQNRNDA